MPVPSLRNRIRLGQGAPGIERVEAEFEGRAFSPHRHDTYAIGITLRGIQTFRYRGERRYCMPGQVHILHPDETHDGEACGPAGFGYRIVYIDPALIQEALGGGPLPFASVPVVKATLLPDDLTVSLWDIDAAISEGGRVDLAAAVADALRDVSCSGGGSQWTPRRLDNVPLRRVRDLIVAQPARPHTLEALERLAGLDRWALARQFRAAFGTSPSRFRTMRQLDQVRLLLREGRRLADAAAEAGFADQSHMTRQFKRAYGLTPARWAYAISGKTAARA